MLFDRGRFHYFKPDDVDWENTKNVFIGYCDPAFTDKDIKTTRKKSTPDDTCIITLRLDVEKLTAYVWEVMFFKKAPEVTARIILDKYLQYRWARFGMEVNNAEAMRSLITEVRRHDPAYKDQRPLDFFNVEKVHHFSDKVFRLNSNLVQPIHEGRILLQKEEGGDHEKLVRQLSIFPLRPPDDGADALEGAWVLARQGVPTGVSTNTRRGVHSARNSRVFSSGSTRGLRSASNRGGRRRLNDKGTGRKLFGR